MARLDAEWKAVMFFYEHAGWSFDPATETQEQGKIRSAYRLTRAERDARSAGITFGWEDDWGVDHQKEFDGYDDGEPETCEVCTAYDEDGEIVGSLACVDDASSEYRRVVEAEIALEALGEMDDVWQRPACRVYDVPDDGGKPLSDVSERPTIIAPVEFDG